MKTIENKVYFTVDDIAYKLKCSSQTVRNKIKKKILKTIKLMGVVYITEDEYKNYLQEGK